MAENVQVKKVKAYPIKCGLNSGAGNIQGQIVKLTMQGFLVEVATQTWKPGEKLQCAFELPVLHHSINEPIVLVKIYNQWAQSKAGVAKPAFQFLAEFHFTALSDQGRNRINMFLSTILRTTA